MIILRAMIPFSLVLAILLLLVVHGFARSYRNLAKFGRQTRLAWRQVEWACSLRRDLARELLRQNQTQSTPAFQYKALADALTLSEQAKDPLSLRHGEYDLDAALKALLQDAAPAGTEELREKLTAATHRIQIAQRFYNDQALVYNAKLSAMPLALAARASGLRPVEPSN